MTKVRIVGGGLTGILAAFEAHRLGCRDIELHERFDRLGGVALPREAHGLELREGCIYFGPRTDPIRRLLEWHGLAFEEFEHGFVYKRLRGGEREDNVMWTTGRVTLWPNGFFLGHHFEWRVPIDDHNTLSVLWVLSRVPSEQEPYVQERIPSWYGPIKDPVTGRWITSHVANQDFVVWVGQGTVTDRTREKLGQSDKGIVMMRRRFFEELEAMQADPAHEPKGLIRDPEKNRNVFLPSACRDEMINGLPRKELAAHPLLGPYLKDFFGQAGQPDEVRAAYEKAIGQKVEGATFFKVHGAGIEEEAREESRKEAREEV